MVAHQIKQALAELSIACEVISEADKCKMCPLKDLCMTEYSIVDTVNKMDDTLISRFVCMAEMITERQEEAEKSEYDRRWEAEADRWNDRRCDPDGYDE